MGHEDAVSGGDRRWAELVGRLDQLARGVGDVQREGAVFVPEWPTDRSRIVRVAILEAAMALRRAKAAALEGVELARLAGLGVVVALLVLAAPAAAQTAPTIGLETVGEFRSWRAEAQAFYLLGALARSAMLGSVCSPERTVGEYRAALVHDVRFRSADLLNVAVFLLEVRNGCETKTR